MNSSTQPPLLQSGDVVGICSTARKISETELLPAISVLNSWGLEVKPGKTLGAEHHQFAGNDDLRTRDFQEMIDDPEVKAIFCARGGYGTVRIIDHLDFSKFKTNPKWIIGYSDITVLHSHVNSNFGIETLHGSMPINFASNSEKALESLRIAAFEGTVECSTNSHRANRTGNASAELVGGNLSILHNLLGSDSDINTSGKILFLEDLDEYLYHIDRMMMALKRNGKLENLAGMLIGGMTDMNDNTIPFGSTAVEIIKEICSNFNYPIGFGFPAGHLDNNNALIIGRKTEFLVSEDGISLSQ